ncbi:type I restriction endonuclease subunit R [Paulownia witches'-broom phytoplasma]|uniref:Type I restriction endonuclease subunit R n=1 Tax=Paulownia witches'-broom phytoplasma TaxID=39647 RepID=A0ABX8TQM8_9MOLU|nr:type I restriction endonuclease subunit R [Paulownia witches'-broom phytoplasma]
MVGRIELDLQTLQEFNSFEKDSTQEILKVENLKEIMQNKNNASGKIIVTTLKKIHSLINKYKNEDFLKKYKNEKMFFIIDECHRSQQGEMHENMIKYFYGSYFLGFTGTPICEKNKLSKNAKTTKELFNKCIHEYRFSNVPKDKFVINYNVEYYRKAKNNSTCKEEVVKKILNSYHDLTQNKKYNALFAVSNIDDLIEYYNIFKNKENEHDLKIAAICSEHFNSENEKNDDKREAFKSIKSDFYKNFSKKNKKSICR